MRLGARRRRSNGVYLRGRLLDANRFVDVYIFLLDDELEVPGEHVTCPISVEAVLPLADHDGTKCVAQDVDEHPALVQDAVDTDDQRERGDRDMPIAVRLLASTTNAPPAIPAVPLLVSIIMPTMASCCCQDRSMPTAWARNSEAIVR